MTTSRDGESRLTRIPLDVVVTVSGQRTPDVLVAVMVADLDGLEAANAHLRATLAAAGEFPCLAPDEDGDPCACCLHVADLIRAHRD